MSSELKQAARKIVNKITPYLNEYITAYGENCVLDIVSAALVTEHQRFDEAKVHLKWALSKVEFPLVYGADNEPGWTGCPGCLVVWEREMQHKPDCEYVAAIRALERK